MLTLFAVSALTLTSPVDPLEVRSAQLMPSNFKSPVLTVMPRFSAQLSELISTSPVERVIESDFIIRFLSSISPVLIFISVSPKLN